MFREQILWVFIEIEKKKNDNNNQTKHNTKKTLKTKPKNYPKIHKEP